MTIDGSIALIDCMRFFADTELAQQLNELMGKYQQALQHADALQAQHTSVLQELNGSHTTNSLTPCLAHSPASGIDRLIASVPVSPEANDDYAVLSERLAEVTKEKEEIEERLTIAERKIDRYEAQISLPPSHRLVTQSLSLAESTGGEGAAALGSSLSGSTGSMAAEHLNNNANTNTNTATNNNTNDASGDNGSNNTANNSEASGAVKTEGADSALAAAQAKANDLIASLKAQLHDAQKTVSQQTGDLAAQESRLQQVLRELEHAKLDLSLPVPDEKLSSVPLFMRLSSHVSILQTEVARLKIQNQQLQVEQAERATSVRQAIESLRVQEKDSIEKLQTVRISRSLSIGTADT